MHSDVDRVRDATDLVSLIGEQVALRPKGREHVGLCPFHDDHSPSMAVVTHKGNAFYKCHACGAGGDALDFVQQYHKMDFPEALRFLADRAGIALQPIGGRRERSAGDGPTRSDLRDANAFAAKFFAHTLGSPAGGAARTIIEQRGISREMVERFSLGAAPDQWDGLLNAVRRRGLPERAFAAAGLLKTRQAGGHYDAFRNRLIFPIPNELGQPVAFGGRKINPEDEPKYLNSAESAVFQKSSTLYGLHQAKRAIMQAGQAIVTEGYTDVITCHQAGLTNVVGTLGTALTREHARLLSKLCDTVVLLFDGDEAGQRAADRGVEVFFAAPVDVKICALPENLDPDDLLRQEGGKARLEQAIDGAIDALAHKIGRFQRSLAGATGLSARQKRLETFLEELASLGFGQVSGVRKRLVLMQLADLLGLPINEVERAMPRGPRRAPQPAPGGAAAEVEDRFEPAMHGAAASAGIHPARRRAEHDLLAILLYDPSLGFVTVDEDEAAPLPVSDAVGAAPWRDPAAHALVRALYPDNNEPASTMQQVLSRLAADELKRFASSLYFTGRERCGETRESAEEALRHAWGAFRSLQSRDEYESRLAEWRRRPAGDPAKSIDHLRDLIAHRRRQAVMPGAINSAVRAGAAGQSASAPPR